MMTHQNNVPLRTLFLAFHIFVLRWFNANPCLTFNLLQYLSLRISTLAFILKLQ